MGDFDSQQNIPRSVPTPPVSEEAQHELDILKEEFRKLQERGNIWIVSDSVCSDFVYL